VDTNGLRTQGFTIKILTYPSVEQSAISVAISLFLKATIIMMTKIIT